MPSTPFNRDDLGHRRLLALAIQDFLNQPGAQLSGTASKEHPTLIDALAKNGVAITRGPLTRLSDLNVTGTPGQDYPSQEMAARVAKALEAMGYWPPGSTIERSLLRLPAFYNGYDPGARSVMAEIEGEFVSYQYSNRKPANILIGRFTIGALTPWCYAPVTNVIEKTGSSANAITFTGVAWSDNLQNIYMLLRAGNYSFPSFVLLDEIERPKGKTIETINGTVLGGARQNHRHLSSLSLHRAPYPDDDSAISPDQHDRIPNSVRNYMKLPPKHGPSNY